MPVQVEGDFLIANQSSEVAFRKHEIEMIRAIRFFDQAKLSVEVCRFPLHQVQLFIRHATWLNALAPGRELGVRRAC